MRRSPRGSTGGARFTKWRTVITIGDQLPTRNCLEVNAHCQARYAALAQEAGLVPIVEPETIMNGTHSIEQSGLGVMSFQMFFFAAFAFLAALAFGLYAARYTLADHYRSAVR